MPLVPARCTCCGAALTLDPSQEAAVCPYCNTPFIVEKAINNYNNYTTVQHADTVNVLGSDDRETLLRAAETFLDQRDYDMAQPAVEALYKKYPADWRTCWCRIRLTSREFTECLYTPEAAEKTDNPAETVGFWLDKNAVMEQRVTEQLRLAKKYAGSPRPSVCGTADAYVAKLAASRSALEGLRGRLNAAVQAADRESDRLFEQYRPRAERLQQLYRDNEQQQMNAPEHNRGIYNLISDVTDLDNVTAALIINTTLAVLLGFALYLFGHLEASVSIITAVVLTFGVYLFLFIYIRVLDACDSRRDRLLQQKKEELQRQLFALAQEFGAEGCARMDAAPDIGKFRLCRANNLRGRRS